MAGTTTFNVASVQTFIRRSSFTSLSSKSPLLSMQPRSRYPRICALTSNDIKMGTNIEVDGAPWRVLEFLHVKPGKGAAFVRTKLRNYMTGTTVDKTFRAGISVEGADVFKETKQFTYKDGSMFVFMDLVIDFEVPITVQLTVVDVDPGLKGDTASGGSKPATLDTGAVVNVPLFVNTGDEVLVNTRTGQYMTRA